jgi:hemolysin III
MTTDTISTQYSAAEEIANSVTHGVGALLSVAGLVILIVLASLRGTAWHVVGVSVFGSSLVVLYTASTLYHGIQGPRAKRWLRAMDHSAIFLLIAGTYTPFTLVNLRGPWGWSLFGAIWGLALLGVILQLGVIKRGAVLSVLLYLAMGWIVTIAIKPLIASVEPGGLALLVAGGLAYTVGVIFYAWRSLKFGHAVWHGFVLAGSVSHFFAVLLYVIPRA